jgi:phage terminase large subunit GpA-like protein
MEQWLVDRFEIRRSKREGMGDEFAPLDPASYPEDWDLLTDKLLNATWRTPLEGREIKLTMLTVDTGGEEGVTHNAYDWYRRVRKLKQAHRVTLYKGATTPNAPVVKESMVGKRNSKSKPDIPLYVCNPNLLSDQVDAGLKRQTPGPNYIHFPPPKQIGDDDSVWTVPQAFYDELQAEVRSPSGTWQQIRKRNESFDLCRMIRAGMLRKGLDKIRDWAVVPAWLAPLELNSEVITVEARREMKAEQSDEPMISEAPKKQVKVVKPNARRPRRSAPSPYLR